MLNQLVILEAIICAEVDLYCTLARDVAVSTYNVVCLWGFLFIFLLLTKNNTLKKHNFNEVRIYCRIVFLY